MTPLRIAFIGTGTMAGHHLNALRHVTTAHSVVGVHDVREEAAKAFATRAGTRPYASLSSLLEEARPDIAHICTPAGRHFEPARQALLAGAHVYVEKPFVEMPQEAETLFALARERGRLICAGHQLIRDAAFRDLMCRAAMLRPVTFVDSHFAFRPPRLDPYRSAPRALADQLLDVLPHPLYTLVSALETFGTATALEILNVSATPTTLHALLGAGEVTGRLCISLRARPVASTLTISGAYGSLTADFVRAIVTGAANEGTGPLEKILNPLVEARQLAWRSSASLARRLLKGADYPGLVDLLGEFYAAAAAGDRSPVSVEHLRRVTSLYEHLAATVRSTAQGPSYTPAVVAAGTRVAVVTGAAGFFGRAISRELASRGFRVRGIGRSEPPDDPHVHEWTRADLADGVPPAALAGAAVVVHAAAETAGGFDAHERNTIGATRELLRAMAAANLRRLVYVSSISVIRPPRSLWERQTEQTARATRAERLGPYTWGKCVAEELVAVAVARKQVEARIIRPGALIAWDRIELPGLVGRRLFGHWHLGLGRPNLPIAVCDVGRAGAAVAWCADHFADAPPIVNLFDPDIPTRAKLLREFRERGWRGRMLWVPISLLATAVGVIQTALAWVHGGRAQPLAVWSILRPRRFDPAASVAVFEAACAPPIATERLVHPIAADVSQVYG